MKLNKSCGITTSLKRSARLPLAFLFLLNYLVVARHGLYWYLPLFLLGMWIFWEWYSSKRGVSSFISPLFFLSLGVIFLFFSGGERSPLWIFWVFIPFTSFLEDNLEKDFWVGFLSGSLLVFLGGWSLVEGEVERGVQVLTAGVGVFFLWFLIKKWKVKYKFLVKRTVYLEKVAERDPLTGLGNRRAFQRLASILLRQEIPFVLAIIDLDGFKECNDTYGHQRGDEVLREFALLLRSMVRGTDFVFRCGGDEFVVLLQMTTPKEVGEVLKRVEDRLENTSLGIGMSWGTAAFPTESKCLQELFQIADQRLYASKKCRKADSKIKP